MKWRQQPARPVLAVSRAKHKANSQSLSEASNNEAYKYAFKRKHHRGVARKTCPFRGGRAHPEPVKGGTDRHKRPCRIARPRQGVVPRNEDWQCPPTATAATGQKEHVRAAGLVRRGAPRKDFAYLHFMRPKRPGRACFACLCQHSRQAETAVKRHPKIRTRRVRSARIK